MVKGQLKHGKATGSRVYSGQKGGAMHGSRRYHVYVGELGRVGCAAKAPAHLFAVNLAITISVNLAELTLLGTIPFVC